MGRAVSDFLKGSLSEGIEWMEGTDFTQLGRDLYQAIRDFIINVDWHGLATDVNRLFGEAIKAAIGVLLGIVDGLFGDVVDAMFGDNTWVKVKNWFINGWNSLIDYAKENSFIVSIADFLGFNVDDLKLDPIEIDATANLTDAKDNVPASKRNITDFAARLDSWKRGWGDNSGYNTMSLDASLSSWKRGWGSSSTYNYMSITASLSKWQRASNWYSKGWDKLSLTGYLTKLESGVKNYAVNLVKMASGGAFFGGKWHNIPQYASGTLNAGSMFIAGESGPEVVGHINGRTEVLNASQLASAIAAGVGYYAAPEGTGDTEDMLYRAFVRALSDSSGDGGDIYLDGEKIYQSVVRHNTQNTRMTGINQLARA